MPQALVESDPSPMKLEILDVEDWPMIINEIGEFEVTTIATETSYIVEGEAKIVDGEGSIVSVASGDLLALLPEGQYRWTITKEIHRHCNDPADG